MTLVEGLLDRQKAIANNMAFEWAKAQSADTHTTFVFTHKAYHQHDEHFLVSAVGLTAVSIAAF